MRNCIVLGRTRRRRAATMDVTIRDATMRDATMRRSQHRWRIALVIATAGLGGTAAVGASPVGAFGAAGKIGTGEGEQETTIFTKPLANVPGKTLTAVTVDYAPGGVSVQHHHAKEAAGMWVLLRRQ